MTERTTQIQTFTGRVIDPLNPTPEMFSIEDIAHSLSMQCRFSGHLHFFYSVAEHSVRASQQVEAEEPAVLGTVSAAFAALMHDGSEYALQDMASPLKNHPVLGKAYREAEAPVMVALATRYGLPQGFHEWPEVKEADIRMLVTERRDLLQGGAPVTEEQFALWEPWVAGVKAYPGLLYPTMLPSEAESAFLHTFFRLGGRDA
jgi:5'-deoxynucleotidase YfbR-like HD superfamily hydrolase